MPLTFPLSLAAFADQLPMASFTPRQGLQQQLSSQGSGIDIPADLAPALREYDITLKPVPHRRAQQIMALIEALRGPLNSFYIYDLRYLYPAADPDGAILGSSVPQINSLNANNHALSLKSLPANYVITAGDFLAWDYGSDPARRAYFRSAETVTANSSGVTAEFELTGFVQPGSATGTTVTLIKPAMKAKLIADSVEEKVDSADPTRTTLSFSVRQTL